MTDDPWGQAEPISRVISEQDLFLVRAAEQLAKQIPPATTAEVLTTLMRGYWLGKVTLYSLRPPPGCEINSHGHVIRADEDPEAPGIVVRDRLRFEWPREKLLHLLQGLQSRTGIGEEYVVGDVTWRSLAEISPTQYDPDGLILHNLRICGVGLVELYDRLAREGAGLVPACDDDVAGDRVHETARRSDRSAEPSVSSARPEVSPVRRRRVGYKVQDADLVKRAIQAYRENGFAPWATLCAIPDQDFAGGGTPESKRKRVLRRISEKLNKAELD